MTNTLTDDNPNPSTLTDQIVPVHTREHDVIEAPFGDRGGGVLGLQRVQGRRRVAGLHSAEATRYVRNEHVASFGTWGGGECGVRTFRASYLVYMCHPSA